MANGALSGLQSAFPWRTREELYKSAFSKPQVSIGPNIGHPGEVIQQAYDPVGEPNRQAAMDELERLTSIEQANENADRARYQNILGEQQEAFTQGFGGPQERYQYERQIAEEKMRQPIKQQELIAQTQRDVTEMQGRNVIEAERERQRGQQELQQQYNEMLKLMQGQAGQSGADTPAVSRFTLPSKSGGGSVAFDTTGARRQVPASILNAVASSRAQLEASRGALGGVSEQAAALYNQAVANALQTLPISSAVREVASFIASNDNLRDADVREILASPELASEGFDLSDITPEELIELNEALLIVRGTPPGAVR